MAASLVASSNSTVYTTVSGECRSVQTSAAEEQRKGGLFIITEGCISKNIYTANEMGVFLRLPPYKILTLKGGICKDEEHSKGRMTDLLASNADSHHQVLGQVTSLVALQMSESYP